VKVLSKVLGDSVSLAIVKYLTRSEYGYLNQLSRELTSLGVASRRSIYERLVDLQTAGILDCAMTRIQNDNAIKSWVKRYTISERHKEWVKELLG
jgi:predicted transcriptional regulator